MSALAVPLGEGPPLLLVHGVGPGPETFVDVARILASSYRVLIVSRPGYGSEAPSPSPPDGLCGQLAGIWAQAASLGAGPYRWVGVSGGATLGIVAAITQPERVACLVAHEPLFGPLASELHDLIVARAVRLSSDATPDAALGFVKDLVGESWDGLPAATVESVRARHRVIVEEVPGFVSFAPTTAELAALPMPVTVSVGERSGRARHDAVATGASLIGADVFVVPGAGHLPQVDDPHGFAELVRATLESLPDRSWP